MMQLLVNMHYNKKEVIKKHGKKMVQSGIWSNALSQCADAVLISEFSSFKYSHLPSPFLKATYWKVWDAEGDCSG